MQEVRDRRDTKFDILGSKFRIHRTSDLEPSPVPPLTQNFFASPAFLAFPARLAFRIIRPC